MEPLTSNDRQEQSDLQSISKHRNKSFLLYCHCILALTAILIFFTSLDVYLWETIKLVAPVSYIYLFIAAVLLLILTAKFSKVRYGIPIELVIWCVVYAAISSFSFLLLLSFPAYSEETGIQQLRTRILSEVFLLAMFLVFSKYPKVQTLTRLAICLAVMLAVFNNLLEFIDPLAFGGLNNTGRAAGFYVNPNITGCALILGMIFGIGVLPQKLRISYALIVLVGVVMTFSRGAMLGWLLVMGIFYKSELISRKQSIIWVASILGISFLFGSFLSTIFDLDELQRSGLVTANFDNIRERLEWFQNPKSEDSADSRLEVVVIAWRMFGDHPLLGNGLASTDNLNNWGISTHNMYLVHIADHGILGIFILPALVFAVTWKAQGESRDIALAFSAFILIWGFFSHNILEERYILVSFSLMAAMNRSSRFRRRRRSFQPQLSP
jgi:O-Antigen ligase